MKNLFMLVFSLVVKTAWCQAIIPTKHQIAKLFNMDEDNTEWTICNQDNSYLKSDTLRLYNNINYFYQKSTCCKLVQWKFYKKYAFTRLDLQICTEPPTGSIITENDYFRIKFSSDKSGLYLFVLNKKSTPEFFQIVGLQEVKLSNNNISKIIVLKRLMSKQPIVGPTY
jgi:hypothetical protein